MLLTTLTLLLASIYLPDLCSMLQARHAASPSTFHFEVLNFTFLTGIDEALALGNSPVVRSLFVSMALKSLLWAFIYRKLAKIFAFLRHQGRVLNTGDLVILEHLNWIWKFLVLSYATEFLSYLVGKVWPVQLSSAITLQLKQVNSIIHNSDGLFMPTFSGSSQLVLAALILVLVQFLNERHKLKASVSTLQSEVDLTV